MAKVQLIPWDPTSDQHYQRMYDQRVACGWRMSEVPAWKERQLNGSRHMYWIVLADDMPGRAQLEQHHLATYPKHRPPFTPVGHTALEPTTPGEAQMVDVPPSTMWVHNLYISRGMHRSGVGRAAMAATEALAAAPPMSAPVVALDTFLGTYQTTEAVVKRQYDDVGQARPAEVRSNQEWFERQGYVRTGALGTYLDVDARTGEGIEVPVIFMTRLCRALDSNTID